jgi:SM-20-related protein
MVSDSFNQPPPFGLISHWLGAKTIERLLIFARENESLFKDSNVGDFEARRIDQTRRRSKQLRKLGELGLEIETKMRNLLPIMVERLGSKPFIPSEFELELVAHGDGAFYSRHIDTLTQRNDLVTHRIISAVYYFNLLPRAFTGGVLRLHSLAASGQQGTFIDIEPDRDTLVFFPSWFPHEVLPISCSSGRFLDSRFAINCWINRSSSRNPPSGG